MMLSLVDFVVHSLESIHGIIDFRRAALPPGVAQSKAPPKPSELAKFLTSPKAKRVEQIVKTKPNEFRMFRELPYKPGLHLLQAGDFAPRDFRPVGK